NSWWFKTWQEAIADYAEPAAWLALPDDADMYVESRRWSPAEKYDLTVDDESFTLTNEQKSEGKSQLQPNGDVEEWMGICHGWALASISVPKPMRSVDYAGTKWFPQDIRALASLSWANGRSDFAMLGGRCQAKKPETYPNGRLSQEECFDTSPATFHL